MREIKEPVILLMCPVMSAIEFDRLACKVKSHLEDWGWGKNKVKYYEVDTVSKYFNLLAKYSQAPIIELRLNSKELYMTAGDVIYNNPYVIKIN